MTYCITGRMAAGKNFICAKMVREDENLVSIDLDETVHEAIRLCEDRIFSAFSKDAMARGIELKDADGSLNRRELGRLICPEPELLRRQESIVYPKVVELVESFVAESEARGKSVLINATVLYKTPALMEKCEKIYFVTAPFLKRLVRARRRDKMPLMQILSRFRSQRHLLSEYKKTGKEIVLVKN